MWEGVAADFDNFGMSEVVCESSQLNESGSRVSVRTWASRTPRRGRWCCTAAWAPAGRTAGAPAGKTAWEPAGTSGWAPAGRTAWGPGKKMKDMQFKFIFVPKRLYFYLLALLLGHLLARLLGHLLAILLGHLLARLLGHLLAGLLGDLMARLSGHTPALLLGGLLGHLKEVKK